MLKGRPIRGEAAIGTGTTDGAGSTSSKRSSILSTTLGTILTGGTSGASGFAPPDRTVRTPEEAKLYSRQLAATLGENLSTRGDKRVGDPKGVAEQLMQETRDAIAPTLWNASAPIAHMLEIHGVDARRLPPNPTIGDAAYEGVFAKQMTVIARKMSVSHDVIMAAVPQSSMPSWVVWRALDETIKQHLKAHGSNLIDKHIAAGGPYLEGMEVDKRIREYVRRKSKKNRAMSLLHQELLNRSPYSDLATERIKISEE